MERTWAKKHHSNKQHKLSGIWFLFNVPEEASAETGIFGFPLEYWKDNLIQTKPNISGRKGKKHTRFLPRGGGGTTDARFSYIPSFFSMLFGGIILYFGFHAIPSAGRNTIPAQAPQILNVPVQTSRFIALEEDKIVVLKIETIRRNVNKTFSQMRAAGYVV